MAVMCLSLQVFADDSIQFESPLLELLCENEIPLPDEGIQEVVEKALLGLVDPGARVLSRDEALQMQDEAMAPEYVRRLPKGIILFKCLSLNAGAADALSSEVNSVTNMPLSGMIFDLRGAGGWDADALRNVTSFFLPEGTPLCRLFSGSGLYKVTLKCGPETAGFAKLPVVVLVDETTTGTAEIFAGTMKGRRDFVIAGVATSGSSCIREFIPAGEGKFLFIATRWADWGDGLRKHLIPDVIVNKNINQEVPRPARLGRRSQDAVDLLSETYSDELLRRASDYILARARLDKRSINDGPDNQGK